MYMDITNYISFKFINTILHAIKQILIENYNLCVGSRSNTIFIFFYISLLSL